MTTTYSPSLKLALLGTGDQSGVWGTTTNTNLGTLLEQAITGVVAISLQGINSYTLTNLNGVLDDARNAVLIFNGTPSGAATIIAPAQNKIYTVVNNTATTVAMTVSGGAVSYTVQPGAQQLVYCDAANVSGNGVGFYTAYTYNGIVSQASSIANSGGWNVTPSGSKLYFNYNGNNLASLDSAGNLNVLGTINAGTTP
jgi:hypothetical protein